MYSQAQIALVGGMRYNTEVNPPTDLGVKQRMGHDLLQTCRTTFQALYTIAEMGADLYLTCWRLTTSLYTWYSASINAGTGQAFLLKVRLTEGVDIITDFTGQIY